MANIKDVARLAGVSISTVSLMINGKRNISTEKYNRIVAAMKELNYRPSMIAQNMKKQRLHLIGVVVPTTEGYYAQILKGIGTVLDGEEYHIIVKMSDNRIQKEEDILDDLQAIGISGLILCPCDMENPQKYKELLHPELPTVLIDRKIDAVDYSSVVFDNRILVYKKSLELLKKYAPSELGLIMGPHNISSERECLEGFRDAVLAVYPDFPQHELPVFETSLERSRAMMALLDRFGGEVTQSCFIVSTMEVAEVLLEIFFILKLEKEIHALDGDVWSNALRLKNSIHSIPREAQKFGQLSAEMMMRYIKNKRPEDNRDIVVENNYPTGDPVYRPQVRIRRKTPLRVLVLRCNAMDVLIKLSKNFTKESGIPLEFTMMRFNELTKALVEEGERFPHQDVLWVDIQLIDTLGRRGRLVDLRKRLKEDPRNLLDSFPKGIRQCFFEQKRGIYGLPIQATEGMLYYRRDLFGDPEVQWSFFNKFGFELRPPKTWAEFNYIAEFFNRDLNPNSPVRYGTVLASLRPTGGFMEEFYIRQRAFSGSTHDKWGKFQINSIENIRALENMVTTYRNSPPESLGYFYEEVFRDLLNGEVAFVAGFPTHYLPFSHSALEKNYDYQIGIAPIPGGKRILGAWVLGLNAQSKMISQGYEFLCWAIREDLALVSGLMGGVIPVSTTFDSTLLQNYYSWIKMLRVNEFSHGLREVTHKYDGTVLDQYKLEYVVAAELGKAFTGELTVQEAANSAQRAVENMLMG